MFIFRCRTKLFKVAPKSLEFFENFILQKFSTYGNTFPNNKDGFENNFFLNQLFLIRSDFFAKNDDKYQKIIWFLSNSKKIYLFPFSFTINNNFKELNCGKMMKNHLKQVQTLVKYYKNMTKFLISYFLIEIQNFDFFSSWKPLKQHTNFFKLIIIIHKEF